MREEYNEIISDYSDFLNEVKRTVEILLRNKIPIAFNTYGRLKEYESIEEKNNSKRFVIKNSITELNDLVGLRIVLLFPEYKDKVIDLLLEEFKPIIDYKKNIPVVDKFGYSSAHLILGIKDEWLKTPHWIEHADKKIEIQVRTLSEHIWAETSHSLFYKREENIPKIITRDLYRLSALLEVVDEKLQNIKDGVSEHFEFIEICPYETILTLDLNSETFKRVMKENSNGQYNLDDNQNRELSSRIERDYNILNTVVLNELISGKIDLENFEIKKYINDVFEMLEIEKKKIDSNQNIDK
jgi:putative GTP pyrophosphokinase